MFSEGFFRDFFGLRPEPSKTSFSEWASNPRTMAMFERDANQLAEIRRLRGVVDKERCTCGMNRSAAGTMKPEYDAADHVSRIP